MAEDEIIDSKARAAIEKHEALCSVLLETQKEANRRNEKAHDLLNKGVSDISLRIEKLIADTTRYDRAAILRWLSFGGSILVIIGTALFSGLMN